MQLMSDENIHRVITIEHESVEVIVKLRTGIAALDAAHQARRAPVARLPGELVLRHFRDEFAGQSG